MISCGEIVLRRIRARLRSGEETLEDAAISIAKECVEDFAVSELGGVIAATFSNPNRFPALSVKVASAIGAPTNVPAFDLQMACSAYPYAVFAAGQLSAVSGKAVLVVDGDFQSPLVDAEDHATGHIFSDAMSATLVESSPDSSKRSCFDFLTDSNDALVCAADGPIKMDGFAVFSFVAKRVMPFLKAFADDFDWFAPHQANPYMIRQLARTLGWENRLLVLDEAMRNPGSCSIPLTLAANRHSGRVLIAGFGAGYSAAAGVVRVAENMI